MTRTILAIALFGVTLISGCASDPAKREVVATRQAEQLAPPNESLSRFGRFELASMTLDAKVQGDVKKAQAAIGIERTVKERLQPLLSEWNARPSGNAARTLVIQPRLVELYIPSGTSRFWAGAFAGESVIDLQLKLTEKGSGAVISQVNVRRNAGAMAGAWSIGKSDKNLVLYIADIAHKYLEDSYKAP